MIASEISNIESSTNNIRLLDFGQDDGMRYGSVRVKPLLNQPNINEHNVERYD